MQTAGLFTNSEELANGLTKASKETTERLWRLPIFEEHRGYMKGKYSDLNNSAGWFDFMCNFDDKNFSAFGSASNGAAFLESFVEKGVNWAHIDIAGYILFIK